MTFRSDYPGAIVVEAANYGYIINNNPKGFVYHCPEEDADDDPQTPGYLAGTTRNASYTYFVSFLGFVFQLVPERHGAYANVVVNKPYPSWAEPNLPPPADNLNLQSLSVSFEGRTATIHKTMIRGQPQWNASVNLVAHRAKRLRISPDNWVRHADVSVFRGDTGSLDLVQFTLDVKAKMEPPEPEEESMVIVIIAKAGSSPRAILNTDGRKYIMAAGQREALNRLEDVGALRIEGHIIPDADWDAIPDEHV